MGEGHLVQLLCLRPPVKIKTSSGKKWKIRGERTVHQLCSPPNWWSWVPERLKKNEI